MTNHKIQKKIRVQRRYKISETKKRRELETRWKPVIRSQISVEPQVIIPSFSGFWILFLLFSDFLNL